MGENIPLSTERPTVKRRGLRQGCTGSCRSSEDQRAGDSCGEAHRDSVRWEKNVTGVGAPGHSRERVTARGLQKDPGPGAPVDKDPEGPGPQSSGAQGPSKEGPGWPGP